MLNPLCRKIAATAPYPIVYSARIVPPWRAKFGKKWASTMNTAKVMKNHWDIRNCVTLLVYNILKRANLVFNASRMLQLKHTRFFSPLEPSRLDRDHYGHLFFSKMTWITSLIWDVRLSSELGPKVINFLPSEAYPHIRVEGLVRIWTSRTLWLHNLVSRVWYFENTRDAHVNITMYVEMRLIPSFQLTNFDFEC